MSAREFGMVFEIEFHQVLLSMASTFYQKASLKQGIQEKRTIGVTSGQGLKVAKGNSSSVGKIKTDVPMPLSALGECS